MAEYIIQDSTLQGIADAIRSKTGDTAPIQTDAFANAISLIETGGGGDTSVEDGLITRGLSGNYTNNRVTTIGDLAFYNCMELETIDFPLVENVGKSAFYSCLALSSVSFPAVTTIGSGAFSGCSALSSVSFPAVTTIGSYAFYWCKKLTTADFPLATTIGNTAFYECQILLSINFPAATTISSSAFWGCLGLPSASFPAAARIYPSAFRGCGSLTTFYLTGSTLCTLSNSNAFLGTGITSTTGSIYVPASLLTSYQTATNWAYFSTQFVAIED